MKRVTGAKLWPVCLFLAAPLAAAPGCHSELANEIVTLSGTYVEDVVTTVMTRLLQEACGFEGVELEPDHSHSDTVSPLHDHDH